MYQPKSFQQDNVDEMKAMMKAYPLATLVTTGQHGVEANHIPLILKEVAAGEHVLWGHMAKANPLWQELDDSAQVLAIFHGPNGYVSPNYYPTKQEHGKVVPTWNYVAVHVRGRLDFIHEDKWKLEMLNNLTAQHESQQKDPWSVNDAPKEFTQSLLGAIVGFEIKVTAIDGKWKAGQNQPNKNRQGTIDGLSVSPNPADKKMAQVMSDMLKPD
ncbi:hypothetical protein A9Q73_08310 [Bermanella sp. 47_1433_sub80_T6]|nr:hypothetical protein A9Q73_08310 [Bermanella sp. 47_1433_sub80_T6]